MPRAGINPTDLHVGARVKVRRIELGMSQDSLGGKLGVSFQQVQKYERGDDRIAASKLHRLSVSLDVPVSYFFEGLTQGGTSNRPIRIADQFLSTREGQKLAESYSSIQSNDIRRAVLTLVTKLAAETATTRRKA